VTAAFAILFLHCLAKMAWPFSIGLQVFSKVMYSLGLYHFIKFVNIPLRWVGYIKRAMLRVKGAVLATYMRGKQVAARVMQPFLPYA
jgi:hypothetical protein